VQSCCLRYEDKTRMFTHSVLMTTCLQILAAQPTGKSTLNRTMRLCSADFQEGDLEIALTALAQFIVTGADGLVALHHRSFCDWLGSEPKHRFFCSKRTGFAALAADYVCCKILPLAIGQRDAIIEVLADALQLSPENIWFSKRAVQLASAPESKSLDASSNSALTVPSLARV
jgi:hypothetical protein